MQTAKALATETARAHEELYEREMAIRLLWRTMGGEEIPGLAVRDMLLMRRALEPSEMRIETASPTMASKGIDPDA